MVQYICLLLGFSVFFLQNIQLFLFSKFDFGENSVFLFLIKRNAWWMACSSDFRVVRKQNNVDLWHHFWTDVKFAGEIRQMMAVAFLPLDQVANSIEITFYDFHINHFLMLLRWFRVGKSSSMNRIRSIQRNKQKMMVCVTLSMTISAKIILATANQTVNGNNLASRSNYGMFMNPHSTVSVAIFLLLMNFWIAIV